MAVAALILGIASLVIPYGGPVLGIVAIVLAVLGKKKDPEKKGMATAGLVMGIIGVAWGVILLIIMITCCGAVAAVGNEAAKMLEEGGLEALEELGNSLQ